MSLQKLSLAASVAGVLSASSPAALPAYKGMVVFGDSLSDSGNAGRFSNGAVWVEHLAAELGLTLRPARQRGTNFAVGGARAAGEGIFDLKSQAAFFLGMTGKLDPDQLYVVWAGGNDLRAHHDPRKAAGAVADVVRALVSAGARHVLVPNLGDVGRTPEFRGRNAEAEGRTATLAFNRALDEALAQVSRGPATLYRLDAFSVLERVAADPTSAGFKSVDAVFWDPVHPTTAAHAQLASAALEALRNP